MIANVASAQTEQKVLSDKTMSDRLIKDLNSRNALTTNQPVMWWDSGNGYYGTYSVNNQNYMTRYDAQGNYTETLMKKEWNNMVSASVVSAFNQSPYKTHQVTSYWEVSDLNRKGYYFELNDKGTASKVWMSDQGKFSSTPITATKPNY